MQIGLRLYRDNLNNTFDVTIDSDEKGGHT